MLAVFDRRQNQFFCSLGAADQLYNDIDIRSAYQLKCIVNNFSAAVDHQACLRKILVGNGLDYDGAAGPTTDLFAVTAQHGKGSATDSANTQQADIYRFHCNAFLNENDEIK